MKFDWDYVVKLAQSLGVKYDTVHQWKFRNKVPHIHRHALIKASKGKLTYEAMDRLKERKIERS
jgi:hypothetical protein